MNIGAKVPLLGGRYGVNNPYRMGFLSFIDFPTVEGLRQKG